MNDQLENSNIEIIKLKQRVYQVEQDIADLKPLLGETIRQEEHYKQIMDTLNEVKEDVKEMKKNPVKYLDYIIMVVISGVVGFIFKIFGG